MSLSAHGFAMWIGIVPELALDCFHDLYAEMGLGFKGADELHLFLRGALQESIFSIRRNSREWHRALYYQTWLEMDARLGRTVARACRLWFREIALNVYWDRSTSDYDWQIYEEAVAGIWLRQERGLPDDEGLGAKLMAIDRITTNWRKMSDVLGMIRKKVTAAGLSEWDALVYDSMGYKTGPLCLSTAFAEPIDYNDPLDDAFRFAKENRFQLLWDNLLPLLTSDEADALHTLAQCVVAKHRFHGVAGPKPPSELRRRLTWE